MIIQLLLFSFVGIAAGISSGLLGISGGLITIPCLAYIFTYMGLFPSDLMHIAIGTSLAAMVFNTLSASISHHKRKGVLFHIIKPMSLGIILGAILGSVIAKFLPSKFLQYMFGVFEILLGVRYFLPKGKESKHENLPSSTILSLISTGIGTISTILGIGGGIINVPVLTHYNINIKKAVGTSSVLSFIVSLIGAVSYLIFGMHTPLAADMVGYLYIPAFIAISLFSFISAPFGAYLSHQLSTKVLKKVFGTLLLIAGVMMLVK